MGRQRQEGGDYAPFEDDYRGFDIREDEASRGPLILALAICVLLIFAGVVWNTYRQGVRPDAGALPRVLAESGPYKTRPADPGGRPVPHTDKQFYNAMDGTETAAAGSSRADQAVTLAGGDLSDQLQDPPEASALGIPLREIASVSPAAGSPEPGPATARLRPEPGIIAAVTTRAPDPQGPLSSEARFNFMEEGPWFVQLAALRSEQAAEAAWRRVTASAPELYHGANRRIQRADLGQDGVFWRLRVGAFADRSEAAAFCEAVREAGSNCIVVTG